MKEALGLVEIRGMSTAIKVADTMVKCANVHIIEMENTRGLGYMTIKIAGDVGAVTAAVEAGKKTGMLYDKLISFKVIPRPADGMAAVFCKEKEDPVKEEPVNEEPVKEEPIKEELKTEEFKIEEPKTEEPQTSQANEESLKKETNKTKKEGKTTRKRTQKPKAETTETVEEVKKEEVGKEIEQTSGEQDENQGE